jgi:CRP-like cAMP-binding protein
VIALPESPVEVFGMSPWRLQIALLPVRRKYPDDNRNAQGAEKREAGRQAGIERARAQKQRNHDAIIELLWREPSTYAAIGLATGLCRETVRNLMTDLEAEGRVQSEKRGGLTRWSLTCR